MINFDERFFMKSLADSNNNDEFFDELKLKYKEKIIVFSLSKNNFCYELELYDQISKYNDKLYYCFFKDIIFGEKVKYFILIEEKNEYLIKVFSKKIIKNVKISELKQLIESIF